MTSSPEAVATVASPHLTPRQRRRGLLLVLVVGLLICFWQLGGNGLVDETPPLFAAAGRAMARTGDWLTPRVNGLPRYDKPPLVYWLMGLGYSLPGQSEWDPLGTWAGRLPSALGTLGTLLMLADTLLRFPQSNDFTPRRTALAAALAFVLSPLVLLWSRTAVSDGLLSGTLAISLLCQWRCHASGGRRWWLAWIVLGLAVLTKGPVAVVLSGISLVLFGLARRNLGALWCELRPLPGLAITALISLPWYALELLVEGQPFWDSFFGYHNFQRFTSVVNSHLQPWWFFVPVLLIAALPFTPLVLLGLTQVVQGLVRRRPPSTPDQSLQMFAACWLLAVFLLFTTAATKLPSYWLPATPAAGLLIALALLPDPSRSRRAQSWCWLGSVLLALVLAAGLWGAGLWVPLIDDPEMPTLPAELLASGFVLRAAVCLSVAVVLGAWLWWRPQPGRLLAMQGPLVVFQLVALVPMMLLGDRVRQVPVRQVAEAIVRERQSVGVEPLAMVGAMKPSLHFYTDQVVIYEGISEAALVNVVDRFRSEMSRRGFRGSSVEEQPTALVVIDGRTSESEHWQALQPQKLASHGIYRLWRVDRRRLEARARQLRQQGVTPDWREPRPERY
ncbi:glycosyltransferase family 39 protein [Synechococcus sp. UW105]|uniref:ArnT family glycosyltransferase n=1 Tax=Synechococcus sp. UW105 TaxID=337067 RepID=UPI000E0E14CC|nr:glycosyltransferase family 39 protein [Synechococcus sp. UW105]